MEPSDNSTYKVAGLMSGTSLDGLDIALSSFSYNNNGWNYRIDHAKTITFPNEIYLKLKNAHNLNGYELTKLDILFGRWCGKVLFDVLSKNNFEALIAASHGHTVFHEPAKGLTMQIGNGAAIAEEAKTTVINDFRLTDVLLGGEGAPLVPVADHILFNKYSACLNIGGFSNISFLYNNKRVAFDIAPANTVMNYLANHLGLPYDKNGEIAKSGKILYPILDKLNALPFYSNTYPKSLGREWMENNILPLLTFDHEIADLLRTYIEHLSFQITSVLNNYSIRSLLITGGGALNKFLIEKLKTETDTEIHIPSRDTILFKEAVAFGFLGLLRYLGIKNVFASVTGSKHDHCSGTIWNKP